MNDVRPWWQRWDGLPGDPPQPDGGRTRRFLDVAGARLLPFYAGAVVVAFVVLGVATGTVRYALIGLAVAVLAFAPAPRRLEGRLAPRWVKDYAGWWAGLACGSVAVVATFFGRYPVAILGFVCAGYLFAAAWTGRRWLVRSRGSAGPH
jgi:hypothetical protein